MPSSSCTTDLRSWEQRPVVRGARSRPIFNTVKRASDFGERPLEEADACARKVVELEPGSAAGLRLRGWIHYSRARIQDAVRDLKAACQIEGSNADTLLLLANCYLISGKVAEARPLIERVLAIDPLTPLSRCMPAFADVMEGNFAAAIEPYRQMCEMDPGNPMARLFYVWALIINQRRHEVVEVMRHRSRRKSGIPFQAASQVFWLRRSPAAAARRMRRSKGRSKRLRPRLMYFQDAGARLRARRNAGAGDAAGWRLPSIEGSSTTRSCRGTIRFFKAFAVSRNFKSS